MKTKQPEERKRVNPLLPAAGLAVAAALAGRSPLGKRMAVRRVAKRKHGSMIGDRESSVVHKQKKQNYDKAYAQEQKTLRTPVQEETLKEAAKFRGKRIPKRQRAEGGPRRKSGERIQVGNDSEEVYDAVRKAPNDRAAKRILASPQMKDARQQAGREAQDKISASQEKNNREVQQKIAEQANIDAQEHDINRKKLAEYYEKNKDNPKIKARVQGPLNANERADEAANAAVRGKVALAGAKVKRANTYKHQQNLANRKIKAELKKLGISIDSPEGQAYVNGPQGKAIRAQYNKKAKTTLKTQSKNKKAAKKKDEVKRIEEARSRVPKSEQLAAAKRRYVTLANKRNADPDKVSKARSAYANLRASILQELEKNVGNHSAEDAALWYQLRGKKFGGRTSMPGGTPEQTFRARMREIMLEEGEKDGRRRILTGAGLGAIGAAAATDRLYRDLDARRTHNKPRATKGVDPDEFIRPSRVDPGIEEYEGMNAAIEKGRKAAGKKTKKEFKGRGKAEAIERSMNDAEKSIRESHPKTARRTGAWARGEKPLLGKDAPTGYRSRFLKKAGARAAALTGGGVIAGAVYHGIKKATENAKKRKQS